MVVEESPTGNAIHGEDDDPKLTKAMGCQRRGFSAKLSVQIWGRGGNVLKKACWPEAPPYQPGPAPKTFPNFLLDLLADTAC